MSATRKPSDYQVVMNGSTYKLSDLTEGELRYVIMDMIDSFAVLNSKIADIDIMMGQFQRTGKINDGG